MEYIKEMLKNKNITIQTLLKSRCVVSVPVVNPDSYDLNVQNHQSSVYIIIIIFIIHLIEEIW